MADSSTAAACIPIPFSGDGWAYRQLHNGISLIPTPLIFMKVPYPAELLVEGCLVPVEAMSEVTLVFRYSTSISLNRVF